jgi:hypothetical protein
MVLAALAGLVLATPAAAEPLRLAQVMEPGGVPPYEVLTIVRSAGFEPLGRPFRRGRNYVLRAIGGDDREVRVVVNARRGEIVRVVPIATASRMPPGSSMGPYERIEPGYVPDGPAGPYRTGPPIVEEDEDGALMDDPDAPRPPNAVPGARPYVGEAAPPPGRGVPHPAPDISRRELPPPSGARVVTAAPPGDGPRVITATEPGRNGLLPPPPERFPQRAPSSVRAKPTPKHNTVASIPKPAEPKQFIAGPTPLPKPRPTQAAAASAAPPVAAKPAPAAATSPAAKPNSTAPAAKPNSKPDLSKALPN